MTNTANSSDMTSTKSVYLERLARFAATQDLSQDKRSYVRDFSIACTALAAVFVALRFLARYRQRARLGADDWLALMAFVLLGGNLAINLVMVGQGLGLHAGVLTLEERQTLDKTMVAAEILYVTAVNVYKLSLLFLYIRIFPIHSVHLGGYICGGLSTAWNLTCAFTAAFQCSPREKLWEPWLEGRCINLFLAHLCIAVPSILLDIAILALPFPHVLPLNTTNAERHLWDHHQIQDPSGKRTAPSSRKKPLKSYRTITQAWNLDPTKPRDQAIANSFIKKFDRTVFQRMLVESLVESNISFREP
ncbi:Eukaryotic peptide chain release factor subunit 1 [Verticillium dahliae VDG2]|nr:Eukaryotic peptide chain release factor subunit 1 [Verticillium dahliae VDG2]